MTLFLALLPLYLFGNLHCMGMCGPLVMLIGHHRYRFFYFFGRCASFSLAGGLAGELGMVIHLFLKPYYLAEGLSLLCGLGMMGWGLKKMVVSQRQAARFRVPSLLKRVTGTLSTLLLKDKGWATFLFGFLTVMLPCGQTLVVFSACAMAGNAWIGLANGLALALFTTPSLALAMHAGNLLKNFPQYDRAILGGSSILVGLLACCRGLAEAGWIPHWVLNPATDSIYHLVIF